MYYFIKTYLNSISYNSQWTAHAPMHLTRSLVNEINRVEGINGIFTVEEVNLFDAIYFLLLFYYNN